jgi:hypothetical protein
MAAAEARDGSLFDLKRDSADNIIHAIVGNVPASKAERIGRGILKELKQARPAG